MTLRIADYLLANKTVMIFSRLLFLESTTTFFIAPRDDTCYRSNPCASSWSRHGNMRTSASMATGPGRREARCGPAVLTVLATSSHCHVGPGHQRGGRSSSTVAEAREEASDARRRERKAREREGAAWREAEAWWREGERGSSRARGRRREVEARRREVVPGRGRRGRWRRRGGRGVARARKRRQW